MSLNQRILTFFCALIVSVACAQKGAEVSYRRFDTRNGLPSTQIQGVFEDSKGYIWAITDRGACRYDGYDFKVYTNRQGLPSNNVLLINEDRKGRIWFMCNTGEYCFLEGDSIHLYGGNKRIDELLKDKLPGPFFFDEHDTLWVTTFSGIQLFKCYGDSVSEYLPNKNYASGSPTYYLRRVGEKLVTLQVGETTTDNRIITADKINYLLEVAGECKLACSVEVDPNTWAVAGPGGFVIFDEDGNIQAFFDQSPFLFSTLEHDRSGHLWLTNSNGAYRLRDVRKGPDDADLFFEGHFITAVLQDRAGNYWFGDRDNGLFFVPSLDVFVLKKGDSGKQNKVVAMHQSEGEIFYSDAQGRISAMDEEGRIRSLDIEVASGVTLDFLVTTDGKIVCGNKPELFANDGRRLRPLSETRTVRRSLNLRNGGAAFALADGLAFLSVDHVWRDIDKSLFKERANALFEEEDGTLLIGANSGLFAYDNDSIKAFTGLNKSLKPRVSDIARIGEWTVLATRNRGIIWMRGEEFYTLSEEKGLVSDNLDCLEADPDGRFLWAGSASGLQRIEPIDPRNGRFGFFRIDSQKGLPSNEVNDILFRGHKMVVATNDGIALLNPDASSLLASAAEVVIEQFSCGTQTFPLDQEIHLNYDQNNLRFVFRSLNMRTGEKTRYRYRLRGIQEEWVISGNRVADLWALPAGDYVFELAAMNEEGEWGAAREIRFVIHPHFTETWWFRVLALLSLAAIIFLSVYFHFRNKRRKLINRAKMSELRQQALNANMNPHFIFNSLNSIQHFIHSNQAIEANEYLSDFSRLIRMNLENNMQSMVSLCDELERLELYLRLEKLRFGDKLSYEIDIQEGLNCMDLSVPPMLLQPYVENAILHGILPMNGNGKITISVKMENRCLAICITDNGIGINAGRAREKMRKHESMALKMNLERLRILSEASGQTFSVKIEDLSDLPGGGQGSRVSLLLPGDIPDLYEF